mmetsp:Transcript_17240/g.24118  ORF Transcript_17240/g.24118 Transcript_17240/m.24118 type:complete len:331 (+) Transcript_17240:156-1148(+)
MLASFFAEGANDKDGFSLSREIGAVRSSKRIWVSLALMTCIFLVGRTIPARRQGDESLLLRIPTREGGADDLLIANPLFGEKLLPQTVPTWLMVLIAVLLPIVVLLLTNAVYRVRGDFEAFIVGLLTSVCLEAAIVEPMKIFCGYPRPNALALCNFQLDVKRCLSASDIHLRSFPSGHSSASFATMLYLSLYLWGKLKRSRRGSWTRQVGSDLLESQRTTPKNGKGGESFSERCKAGANMLKGAIIAAPTLLALFIATSRIRDRYHWPADVIMGGLIGSLASVLAYLQSYPAPWGSSKTHLPRTTSAYYSRSNGVSNPFFVVSANENTDV